MASTIKIKNSSTAGAVPTSSDLVQGELAINVTDRRIFTENASGTVVELGTPSIDDNGNATAITIDSSENIGIGTSSPAVPLDVNGRIRTRSGTNFLDMWHNGTVAYVETTGGASTPLAFATASTERARFDTSGNLLVGTTSSTSAKIDVAQSTANYAITETHTNAGAQYFIKFVYGSTQIGSIQGNNTATSYNTSSDYRLKNSIAPMTGALEKVIALKPCTYKWNSDDSDGEGFIAHELAEVCPHAVTGEKDAVDAEGNPIHQGIDTSFLVATLTAAIQEQQALITTLTERITALEQA